ncbi:MAG TPA: helix-turn-helix domain-containing protein [Thermoplasmata archaeon]|nr:helix-turn-helix domain-containing protein [Thermoplasmata archaeon]
MARAAGAGLSDDERTALLQWARRGAGRKRIARRARIVLAWAEGRSTAEIARRLDVSPETVARWRDRFRADGVDGILREAPRAGARARLPKELVEKILSATLDGSGPDHAPWSTRSLAKWLGTNHMAVHRVWHAYGLIGPRTELPPGAPRPPPRVDLAGAYMGTDAAAIIFSVEEPRVPGPELEPPEDGSSDSHVGRASELVETVRSLAAQRPPAPLTPPSGRATASDLLVLLRSIEKRTPRTMRLDAVFDRPVEQIGSRLSRWLENHPRFRVYSTSPGEQWVRSTELWLSRWEGGSLDPRSFRNVAALRQQGATGISGGRLGASFPVDASVWPRSSARKDPPKDEREPKST